MTAKEKAEAKFTQRNPVGKQDANNDKLSKEIEMHVHMIDEDRPDNNRSCCISDAKQLEQKTGARPRHGLADFTPLLVLCASQLRFALADFVPFEELLYRCSKEEAIKRNFADRVGIGTPKPLRCPLWNRFGRLDHALVLSVSLSSAQVPHSVGGCTT
eukprot:1698871-Prymnesium_polylepis.2